MKTEINSDHLQVKINDLGAELCSVKNKKGLEFIWQAKELWPRHSPVLFPIVGKLKDNEYVLNGKTYKLSQHGFARDKKFELTEQQENTCKFMLRADEDTKKIFPFDFTFEIEYVLNGNELVVNYKVTNPSRDHLLFSLGAHPGFNCPLLPSEKHEDYFLEFENNVFSVTTLNNGLRRDIKEQLNLHRKRLSLSPALFENDALVFETDQVNKISLCSGKSAHKITLQAKNWPYFGIWSKKGCREFVCLEPWYGVADRENTDKNLEKKEGIMMVNGRSEFKCAFSMQFF